MAPDPRVQWDLAGMTDQGRLGVPVGLGTWTIPSNVRIDGKWLLFTADHRRAAEAGRDLLDRFANAQPATRPSEKTIQRLAAKYGPLFYEPDDRGHDRRSCRACRNSPRDREEQRLALEHYKENIGSWRQLIRDVRGCLTVVSRTFRDTSVRDADWNLFGSVRLAQPSAPHSVRWDEPVDVILPVFLDSGWESDESPAAAASGAIVISPYERRTMTPLDVVAHLVNLMASGVTMRFTATAGLPRFSFRPHGVLGALGIALGRVCTKEGAFAMCAGCGRFFPPRRKPRAGEDSWCGSEECLKRRQRAADARRRVRKRGTSNLAAPSRVYCADADVPGCSPECS